MREIVLRHHEWWDGTRLPARACTATAFPRGGRDAARWSDAYESMTVNGRPASAMPREGDTADRAAARDSSSIRDGGASARAGAGAAMGRHHTRTAKRTHTRPEPRR